MLGKVLHGDAVGAEAALVAHALKVLAVPLGEAPLLGHVDLRNLNKKYLNIRRECHVF